MNTKERTEAVNAIVEFMKACPTMSSEDYDTCISKIMALIRLF